MEKLLLVYDIILLIKMGNYKKLFGMKSCLIWNPFGMDNLRITEISRPQREDSME